MIYFQTDIISKTQSNTPIISFLIKMSGEEDISNPSLIIWYVMFSSIICSIHPPKENNGFSKISTSYHGEQIQDNFLNG